MMKTIYIALIILCSTTLARTVDSATSIKFNDGPYVMIEADSFVTYYVVEGQLKRHPSPKDAPFAIDLSPSVTIDLDPSIGWAHIPTTSYVSDEPIVAISDIHGQYGVFRHLLTVNNVIDEQLNWSFGKGNLVIVGDVMDRGDQVLESLWLIYKLEQQAERSGGKVHFLLGNHELMVMNGRLDYLNKKYLYTSALFKKPYYTLFGYNTLLGQWLHSKNVILKIKDKLFVHGGLSQQAMTLGLTIDDINSIFREKLYFKSAQKIQAVPELSTLYYEDGPLWYRGYAFPYSFNKAGIDSLLTALDLQNIIVGHTTLPNIKGLYGNRIILIDSSIKLGITGELLHINNGQISIGDMYGDRTALISEELKTEERASLFDHIFSKDEVFIDISESTRIILSNYRKEESVTPSQVTINFGEEQLTFSANLKPGGKSRRKICSNPPIKINLHKADLENTGFLPEHDKLKIVFQCDDSNTKAQTIKIEKCIYDLHNIITPYSHQAKLISVKTSNKKKYISGILLESREDLSLRVGISEIEVGTIATEVLDRSEYVKMCLFQFMIANTDWSARKMHNSKLYNNLESDTYITIPYDFDLAGIINNDYAVTSEKIPISKVTQRYFMDKKISLEELKTGIQYYLDIENEIILHCQNISYLSDNTKIRVEKFIHNFYKIIKNDKLVARMLKR